MSNPRGNPVYLLYIFDGKELEETRRHVVSKPDKTIIEVELKEKEVSGQTEAQKRQAA